ncbi:MAG: hypothetical protein LBS64_02880 [Spirochaetaceae bacterium]|nr:hypothetical protein [Spirochaetaceae bacterium]
MKNLRKFMVLTAIFALLASCKTVEVDPPEAYYVDEFGNDHNDGVSEKKPFRTLQRAVDAALFSGITRIVVSGTLRERVVINEANGEILITGRPHRRTVSSYLSSPGDGRLPEGTAVLTSLNAYRTLAVSGLTRVRLEYIAVIGNIQGGGILVADKAELILGDGARVAGNHALRGAGIHVAGGGRVTLEGDAAISRNSADIEGGGVFVHNGTLYLLDGAVIVDNKAASGGGVSLRRSRLTLYGRSSVVDNEAANAGGGVFAAEESSVAVQFGARVLRNTARRGGGIFTDTGSSFTNHNGLVADNQAAAMEDVYHEAGPVQIP